RRAFGTDRLGFLRISRRSGQVAFRIRSCLQLLVVGQCCLNPCLRVEEVFLIRLGGDRLAIIDGSIVQKLLNGNGVFGLISEGFVGDTDVIQAVSVLG